MSPKVEVIIAAANKLDKGLNSAESRLKKFQRTIMAPQAIVGGLGVTAIATAVKGAIDYGSAINDMANKTGIGIEQIQRLDYIAKQSGTSIEGLRRALQEGAKRAAENSEIFKKLGIVYKDDQGNLLDINKIFENSIDVLAGVKSKTEQAAIAQKLFGKSAGEVLAIAGQGRDAIRGMFDELDKGGLILREDVVKALDDAGDRLATLNQQWKVMSAELVNAVVPAVSAAIPKLQELARGWGYLLNSGRQEEERKAIEAKGVAIHNLTNEIAALQGEFEKQNKLRGLARNSAFMSQLENQIIEKTREKNLLINEVRKKPEQNQPSSVGILFEKGDKTEKLKRELEMVDRELARIGVGEETEALRKQDEEQQRWANNMMSQIEQSRDVQEELTRIKAEHAEFRARIDEAELVRIQSNIGRQMDLFTDLGAAIGGSIGQGAKGVKQALKGVLITILSFVEKEMLAAVFAGAAQSVIQWNAGPLIKALGITAAFEGAKAGIASFRMGTQYAPGGVTQLHRDEVMSVPAGARVYNSSEVRQRGMGASKISIVQNISGSVDRDTLDRSNRALLRDLEKMSRRGLISGISFAG